MIYLSTDDDYEIRIPSFFHSYQFIKFLNKGKYSAVVQVEDLNSKQNFAAKIISKKDLNNKQEEYLIQNEINILSSIDHPNIIKFYEAFSLTNDFGEEYFIIITEYCENGDLFDYLIENEFGNEEEKKNIIMGLLKAVQYLHKLGISHCDIKPENILLDHNMNAKLCDFGYATHETEFDENNHKGTTRYSSPEMLMKKSVNLNKSDIWSVGMTMYVISEKHFPFNAEDENYAIYQIVNGYIFINPDDELQYIINKCIKMNPNERPTIKEIINEEYFDY